LAYCELYVTHQYAYLPNSKNHVEIIRRNVWGLRNWKGEKSSGGNCRGITQGQAAYKLFCLPVSRFTFFYQHGHYPYRFEFYQNFIRFRRFPSRENVKTFK